MTPETILQTAAETLARALSTPPPAYVRYVVDSTLTAPLYLRTPTRYRSTVTLNTTDGTATIRTKGETQEEQTAFPLAPNFDALADTNLQILVGMPNYIAFQPAAAANADTSTVFGRYTVTLPGDANAPMLHVHLVHRPDDRDGRLMHLADVYVERETLFPRVVELTGPKQRRLRLRYSGTSAAATLASIAYHVESGTLGVVDYTATIHDVTAVAHP